MDVQFVSSWDSNQLLTSQQMTEDLELSAFVPTLKHGMECVLGGANYVEFVVL